MKMCLLIHRLFAELEFLPLGAVRAERRLRDFHQRSNLLANITNLNAFVCQ